MLPIQPWLIPINHLDDAASKSYNKERVKLYNAAENGDWENIWSILNNVQRKYGESWANCFTSDEGWTLLHYAAFEPQPVSTCEKLIKMGAWRSVKTTSAEELGLPSDMMTPYEIAKANGFKSLYHILKPSFKINISDSRIQSFEEQFRQLICEDMDWDDNDERILPGLGVLREGNGIGHFPIAPGVNKTGYIYRLAKDKLFVWSIEEEGNVEFQWRVTKTEVATVDEDDNDYEADAYKMISSGGKKVDHGVITNGARSSKATAGKGNATSKTVPGKGSSFSRAVSGKSTYASSRMIGTSRNTSGSSKVVSGKSSKLTDVSRRSLAKLSKSVSNSKKTSNSKKRSTGYIDMGSTSSGVLDGSSDEGEDDNVIDVIADPGSDAGSDAESDMGSGQSSDVESDVLSDSGSSQDSYAVSDVESDVGLCQGSDGGSDVGSDDNQGSDAGFDDAGSDGGFDQDNDLDLASDYS
ncbi:hypothetical protein DM02DRAFT_655864 [Periconia macrospinosa]|uniref:Ankyrin n=1 Tax=Periconia macrospinosa TaxID=97972 RepID=A0A2V1DPI8_9PLEO|nr:hypothetical protein DM02DRAFT_655864 [Periconia macrospinosa]